MKRKCIKKGLIHIKDKSGEKKGRGFSPFFILLSIIIFFSAPFLVTSVDSQEVSFSVNLKEWLILEVSTPSGVIKGEGTSSARVSSELNINQNPVDIRVLLCVSQNQEVKLRVHALGDLNDSQGNTFPVSKVSWKSTGEGFRNGRLDKDYAQIMGVWRGPGYHRGEVNYYYNQAPKKQGGYSQTVIYTLTTT